MQQGDSSNMIQQQGRLLCSWRICGFRMVWQWARMAPSLFCVNHEQAGLFLQFHFVPFSSLGTPLSWIFELPWSGHSFVLSALNWQWNVIFFHPILVWIQVVAILAEGRERRYTWDLCASAWVAGQCAEQFQRRFLGCHSCSSQYSRFVSWSVSMVAVSCCSLPYPPKVLIPIGYWISPCHGHSLWSWWQCEGSLGRSDWQGGETCEWSWRAWGQALSWVSSATSDCCLYTTHILWFLRNFGLLCPTAFILL